MTILESSDRILPSGPLPFVIKRDRQSPAKRSRPQRFKHSFSERFIESWRRMRVMHAVFKHSESGGEEQSQEPSEERLGDEQAWSRMDDEGCPNEQPKAPSISNYESDRA
jgi:hypothetical protein